ncbi:MAG: beta-phosphoglucomutase, partial [Lactobacillus iners]|nr:beta-phosphoglucomutase [Lactobacillus iners]MCT7707763.1 beta-phosphoglucomutase [Lactobacillus iners]
MLKGLIFDLDGVLTDSARYHLAAWSQLAEKLGIHLDAK